MLAFLPRSRLLGKKERFLSPLKYAWFIHSRNERRMQTCWDKDNRPFKAFRSMTSRDSHFLLQMVSDVELTSKDAPHHRFLLTGHLRTTTLMLARTALEACSGCSCPSGQSLYQW
jgi:hypothetical protein